MKWKIYKEANEMDNEPKVYVGTYGKYNDGSIDGKWVTLTDFSSYDEFMDYCREIHGDESDPEFMLQDFENFPKAWYNEGGIDEETFDNIIEYARMGESEKEAFKGFVDNGFGESLTEFRDSYVGTFSSKIDAAQTVADELQIGEDDKERYFDYRRFGRELMYDFHIGDPSNNDSDGEPEDENCYYDNDGVLQGEYVNDSKVAEDYIDAMGSINELGNDTIERYFDWEAYARDLFISDMYFDDDTGAVYWRH